MVLLCTIFTQQLHTCFFFLLPFLLLTNCLMTKQAKAFNHINKETPVFWVMMIYVSGFWRHFSKLTMRLKFQKRIYYGNVLFGSTVGSTLLVSRMNICKHMCKGPHHRYMLSIQFCIQLRVGGCNNVIRGMREDNLHIHPPRGSYSPSVLHTLIY